MTVLKNFAYNFIYRLLIIIVPLITMPYVSRVLGVDGVGLFSYTYAIANYFVLFSMLGLEKYGNRQVAKVRDEQEQLSRTFWSIYFMQVIISVIVIIAYAIFILVGDDIHFKFKLIQMIFVFSSLFNINWLFYGLEKFKFTVIRNSLVKILTLILIFAFVNSQDDLIIYVIIMATSYLISSLLLWPQLGKIVKWYLPSFKEIFVHLKPNLILFIPVISISLYKVMDKVMIGTLSDLSQLGYYENAEKINYIQITLATTLGTVMLPRMSNIVAKGMQEEVNSIIRNSMQFVMFLSVALCFGLISIAQNFVPLFLGESFLPSTDILILLAPTGIFVSWANVIRTQYLIPNGWDKNYVTSVVVGALLNVGINLILIPSLGAKGAAIGTIVAEGSVMIIQTYVVRNALNITKYVKDSIVFIPIAVIMVIGVELIGEILSNGIIELIAQVFTGITIYCTLTFVYFYYLDKNRLLDFKKVVVAID